MLTLAGCRDIDKVADAINQTGDKIVQQSGQWQTLMRDLESDLTDKKEKILAAQVHALMVAGIATAGTQGQCMVDFVADRMVAGLKRIRASLDPKKYTSAPDEYFCLVNPGNIDLLADSSVRRELTFTGFNLRPDDIKVWVIGSGPEREITQSSHLVAVPTSFALNINISDSNGIQFAETDHQLQVQLAGGARHSVNILARTRHYSVGATSTLFEVSGVEGGGSEFRDECKGNAVAVGLLGRAGGSVDELALQCSPLIANGLLGAVSTTETHGGGGGDPFGATCPAGSVLVGIGSDTENQHGRPGRLSGQCQSIASLVGATAEVTLTSIGTWGYWNGTRHVAACAPGDAITGMAGRAGGPAPGAGGGTVLKHLAFVCRAVITAPQS
jgi:hypothetical protein